jgi:hypothetical protein
LALPLTLRDLADLVVALADPADPAVAVVLVDLADPVALAVAAVVADSCLAATLLLSSPVDPTTTIFAWAV